MIPILYDRNERDFDNNGLGRLRDCITCVVTEERNGIYECDFEYPVSAEDFKEITIGRIIGVTHDETDDIQPFDIVSYTRPIDGVVKFHAVHISYRLTGQVTWGSNINSLASALNLCRNIPNTPFTYTTDKTATGYLASANGVPISVRSMLGGVEGSILDAYGGEYEWDKWNVILHSSRGRDRDFSIRYGVNMLDYEEELDAFDTYSSCVPYWTDGTSTVIGSRQDSGGSLITGRGRCVPLDVSDKFESKPTKVQVEAMGRSVMLSRNSTVPAQNIHVEFVRLQDLGYEDLENLFACRLCDTINVVFPNYETQGRFKIVKVTWDVLADRYESMELGDLSVTLSEALGIGESSSTNYISPDSSGNVTIAGNLTVNGHATSIGYANTGSGSKSIATGNTPLKLTDTAVTVSPGTWLLVGDADFAPNATGTRYAAWANGTTVMDATRLQTQAVTGGFSSRLQVVAAVKVTETTDFNLYCYQNSGSALTVGFSWQIVRIA